MSDPFVKIITHSVGEKSPPIITAHFRYWRGIHPEIMTHRVFSRNARSSRAVPISKILEEVRVDPFIPRYWGRNQKGMQAGEENNTKVMIPLRLERGDWAEPGPDIDSLVDHTREEAWLHARDEAVKAAEAFANAGYHKQLVNRLLEPFMWIDTLITSTHWKNFFALRDHKDAEPHFRDLAHLAKEVFSKSEPTLLRNGQWHTPFIKDEEKQTIPINNVLDISAARCARISYTPFDGNSNVIAELERAHKLKNYPVHASPFEHQALVDNNLQFSKNWGNFYGWVQNRTTIVGNVEKESWMV